MKFVAIDGEAFTFPDGARYCLMCSSTGDTILNYNELSTEECFDFLLRQARPKTTPVVFGLNYDVNMWLRDIDYEALQHLWSEKICWWRNYRVEWLPRRWFRLLREDGKRIAIYEPFGFFQGKFVDVCKAWGIPVREDMAETKALRGSFDPSEEKRIVTYCKAECGALVLLMEKLRAACLEAGVIPYKWEGAGALAQTLLNNNGVKDHHEYDENLGDALESILCAYKGGRVEMLSQGVYEQVSGADIVSAYPSVARNLPSLRGAKLQSISEYNAKSRHAIWHCQWRKLPGNIMPFAVRYKRGIWYPTSGEGYYHASEVLAARKIFGSRISVDSGYILQPRSNAKPFQWISDTFNLRNKWKLEGKESQKVLKLALNSLYGKMAQGIGHASRPKYQSYWWAGEVTAAVRASMFLQAWAADSPLMITTDGLLAASAVQSKSGLGGWDTDKVDSVFIAQPGVYAKWTGSECYYRSRGFLAREVNYDELLDGYREQGAEYVYRYTSHRFVGLGVAIRSRTMDEWRRWVDKPRVLSLYPTRKNIGDDGSLYPTDINYGESEPYQPKGGLDDVDAIQELSEFDQPLTM